MIFMEIRLVNMIGTCTVDGDMVSSSLIFAHKFSYFLCGEQVLKSS